MLAAVFCCCAVFSPYVQGAGWYLWSIMLMMKDLVIIRVQHWEFRILSCVPICTYSKLFSFVWSRGITDISSQSWAETDTKSKYLEHITFAEVQSENNLSDKSWVSVCEFHFVVSRIYKEGGWKFVIVELCSSKNRIVPRFSFQLVFSAEK